MTRLTLKDIKLDPSYFPFKGSWQAKKKDWSASKNKLVDTVVQTCTIKDFRQDADYHIKRDRDFINRTMHKSKQEDADPFFCLDSAYSDIL